MIRILGRLAAGSASDQDLVDWGVSALVAGLDTPRLRVLAGLSPPLHWSEVHDEFERSLAEINVQRPPAGRLLAQYARQIARDVVEGTVSPVDGCRHDTA